jgi:ATP-dependent exoDNAse (exonuclease V) beta subunit
MIVLPDSQHRQQALAIHSSFVVQAPAGSGKTELLISRLLALFASDDTKSPEQVLAITFTRKAAAEMITRLLSALRAANKACDFDDWLLIISHSDSDKAEKLKQNPDALTLKQQQYHWAKQVLQKDWSLLNNPHRLRITTIDGFCNALARQTPLLGQLAPGLDVADDVLYLYDMAARQTLAHLENNDSPELADAIATLLPAFGNDIDKLRGLLAEQLANRDQWLVDLEDIDTDKMQAVLTRLFAPQITDYLLTLESNLPELARLAGVCLQGLLANENQDTDVHNALAKLNDCGVIAAKQFLENQILIVNAIAFLLLTKDKKGWRKSVNKTMGLAAATNKSEITSLKSLIETYEQDPTQLLQLQSLVSLPNPTYSDDDHQRIAALKMLFSAAARQLLLVFAEHRQTDHAQFTQAALIALDPLRNGNISDVLLKLDAQLRHILIDEFQDTSVTQWALLRHLMAGWESVGMGQEKQGRTLFLVGDPMQSIYRFRKAEPALFTTAKTQGIPLDNGQHFKLLPLQLSSNFRSLPAMIDFANTSFSDIFPTSQQAQADVSLGACSYSPAQAVKDDKNNEASIQLWLQTDAKKCTSVSWYDSDLTQDFPILLTNTQVGEYDAAQRIRLWLQSHNEKKPSGVAILVRSKSHLLPILTELNAHNIPIHAEEIATLTDRWYIQDCLALTRFLVDPCDRVAFLAVLRAPWCGLSLAGLHNLAQQPDPLWDECRREGVDCALAEDQQRLTQFISVLTPLMTQRGHQPLATQVRSACLALGLLNLLPDDSAVDDVAVYWDLLRQLQQVSPHFDLPTLNKKLEKLFAKPTHSNAPVVAMTIHKSKGLEFDTVILPSLDRRGANDKAGLLSWQKLAEGDGMHDIIAPLGKRKSPLFGWLQSLEKKKAKYELDRLFYVALTRAVKQLILIATLSPNKGNTLPVSDNTFIGCLWKSERIKAVTERLLSTLPLLEKDNNDEDSEEFVFERVQPHLMRFESEQLASAQASITQIKQHIIAAAPLLFLSTPQVFEDVPINEDKEGTAVAIGTVTHALLERVANDGLAVWDSERLSKQTTWLGYQLRVLAVPESKQAKAIATIIQAIENTLSDEKGQWILQHWQQARNEWVLMDIDDVSGKLQRHILDRSFIDAQGTRWIVDYKTSQVNGVAIDAFIANKRAQYYPQLERYRHLVQQLDPVHPIQTALFFPLLPAGARWQFGGEF